MLTNAERDEVRRLVDEGRPLPEKYRLLLFADKREVELIWTGKTNEVCNVVLPFQTIEQVDEPRAEMGGRRRPTCSRSTRAAGSSRAGPTS